MSNFNAPHVIAADRLDGDLVIEFKDGSCGIYTSEFLYAALPQALPVSEAGSDGRDNDDDNGS